MRYFLLLLGLIITWSYLELTLLLVVANHWGWGLALASTILTGIGGIAIARSQGWYVAWKISQDIEEGRVPVASMFDGLLLLVAGVLLLLPGLISDAVGLLLLVPWSRKGVRWLLVRYWFRQSGEWNVSLHTRLGDRVASSNQGDMADPNVIEGEIVPPDSPSPRSEPPDSRSG